MFIGSNTEKAIYVEDKQYADHGFDCNDQADINTLNYDRQYCPAQLFFLGVLKKSYSVCNLVLRFKL